MEANLGKKNEPSGYNSSRRPKYIESANISSETLIDSDLKSNIVFKRAGDQKISVMALYDLLLFGMGLYHNILLIILFYSRERYPERIPVISKFYLGMMVPVSIIIAVWAIVRDFRWGYLSLTFIIIAYLLVEILYDYLLKLDWRSNWKLATPYLVFYYMANYAITVLNWEYNVTWGIILLILFVIQIVVNIWSHPRETHVEN